jgi:polar amino acid transport system substrate-binding protein
VLRCYLFLLLSLAITLAGCDRYPQDPDESLEHIIVRGTLRVGALPAEPWVVKSSSGELAGVEGELIRQFADELGVSIQTHWLGEDDLFQMLANHDLDVVMGGMTRGNPWSAHAGFTLPYYTNDQTVGVPPGSPAVLELEGITVGILRDSPLSTALEKRGAMVKRVNDYAQASLPVAGPAWQLKHHGLRPTTIQLLSREHVMAVPRGENALLMRLERFLLARAPFQIEDLLAEEAAL